jgi:MYXO-CTERM domain-containing protein
MGDYGWNDSTGLFGAILDDQAAAQQLDVYAVHGYLNGVDASTGTADGWVQIDQRVRGAGKDLWMTETSDGGNETTWTGAWDMTRGLHLALRYGQINAWVYWYYAGAIVENGAPLPLYHLFKGWYRYVRPGFVQVASSSDDLELLVTAFERSGSLTVVLMNDADTARTIDLAVTGGPVPASFDVHRASEADGGFVAAGTSSGAGLALPSHSVTTLSYVSPSDPGDPGTGGSGGSAGSGAGGIPDAGAANGGAAGTDGPSKAGDDGGCGCRTSRAPHGYGSLFGLGLVALLIRLRTRRSVSSGRPRSDMQDRTGQSAPWRGDRAGTGLDDSRYSRSRRRNRPRSSAGRRGDL